MFKELSKALGRKAAETIDNATAEALRTPESQMQLDAMELQAMEARAAQQQASMENFRRFQDQQRAMQPGQYVPINTATTTMWSSSTAPVIWTNQNRTGPSLGAETVTDKRKAKITEEMRAKTEEADCLEVMYGKAYNEAD